jgi:hypothetical protein
MEPGCNANGAASNFKGGCRVRRATVGAPPITLSPHSIGWTLRWRAIMERCRYEGWCVGTRGGADA